MAFNFVVEDGTGEDATANSYVSLTEFADYHTLNGFDYSIYTSPAIERSLAQATQYIELVYGRYFVGYLLLDTQPLSWPRTCVYRPGAGGSCIAVEGIPKELKNATNEYAKRILESTVLMPDPANFDETGLEIAKSFEKIGPIEVRKDYFQGTGSAEVRGYPAADKWIMQWVRGMQSRSIRA